MTMIAQALAPYYSNMEFATSEAKHKFEMAFLGGKLNSDMNSLAANHAGWQFFNWYWRRFDGRDSSDIYSSVHPDTLIAAAASLGFVDVEPLQGWVDSLKEPMAGKVQSISIGSSSSITLPYDAMPDIQFGDLIQAMKDSGATFTADAIQHALDDVYKAPSITDVQVILSNCPTRKMQYRANREDCDKFAQEFKAWLGYLGYGNVSVGYVEMSLWTAGNQCVGAHAVNVVVYRDMDNDIKAKFIEPQTNTLHDLGSVWVGGGINGTPVRNEIYWIVF